MGRPRLEWSTMTEKQRKKRILNERVSMKKKGNVFEFTGGKKEEEVMVQVSPVQQSRLEVPFCDPKEEVKEKVWSDIERKMKSPIGILYTVSSVTITSYLIFQNVLSMIQIDRDIYSAVSSSVISEMIPIVCSGLLVISVKRMAKFFLSLVLFISILGLGIFFESNINQKSNKEGFTYTSLVEEKELIAKESQSKTKEFDSLPENNRTRKSILLSEIKLSNEKVSQLNQKIGKAESSPTGNGGTLYMIWVRICAILLNCYLVHALFYFINKK